MKKILKSIMGLCLAVTLLFGSGITVKAADVRAEWSEGLIYILQEGDGFWIRMPDDETGVDGKGVMIIFEDNNQVAEEIARSKRDYSDGYRYVECKFTPDGKKGVYWYTYVPGTQTITESNAPSCSDHNYEWVTTSEATPTVAGEKAYQCTKCSHIESYAEVSGYLAFNEDAMKAIKNAAANGTVIIDTKMWVSFHKSVFDTLGARKDVAVTVNFKHEGKNYTTTIPAGADLTGLTDEKGFCGFLNLMAKFGGSEVVK